VKVLTATTSKAEATSLLRIAVPLATAYLAELAMLITSKLVVGRLGYEQLAAVGLASGITLEFLAVLMGLLSVVAVLVAQAEGNGERDAAGQAGRQGMLLGLAVGIAGTVFILNLHRLLPSLGQDPQVVAYTVPYLEGLAYSVLPFLWFSVLRCFVSALGRANGVMFITVAGVLLHIPLTIGLVEGRFGLPPLGLAGAGWATSITAWGMFAALLAQMFWTPALRGYGFFKGKLRVNLRQCQEIIALGTPVGGLVFLESALFAAVSILSGVLGADTLAAYEILIAWVAISFMLALGLAEATMVRVAHGVGRGDQSGVRLAGILGMASAIAFLIPLVLVTVFYPELIIAQFLSTEDPGFERVSGIALALFGIAALFQIFDGLQATAARALRGLRDTMAPLWIAALGYWVIGIGGGALLAFGFGWGATGLWWGLAAGLIATAIALSTRFLVLTRTPPGGA